MTEPADSGHRAAVASAAEEATAQVVRDAPAAKKEKPRGLWGDAWRDLRRRPLFIVGS